MIERSEIDERQSYITSENLDFSYGELEGVNEVHLSVSPLVAGTSITASALLQDRTHPVEGLLFGDFKVTKNGVASNPTVATYNSTTKKYALTVPAMVSTDIIEVSLNGIVLTSADVLYKSNVVSAVVV